MGLTMRRFFFLWILVSHVLLAETRDIDNINDIVEAVDEETLVIFDIDETLIYYPQMILSPQGFRMVACTFIDQSNAGVSRETIDRWWGEIFLHCSPLLIEEKTAKIFEDFSRRGILCLGLTRRPSMVLGSIRDSGDFILEALDNLHAGFTFLKECVSPTELGSGTGPDVAPIFKKGCIFAARQEKGPILGKFFEALEYTPKKVVFVDDRLSCVESVEKELNSRGITNVCFHYGGAHHLDIPFDKETVKKQLDRLIKDGAWLSEENALN